jgi:hypothetical protein
MQKKTCHNFYLGEEDDGVDGPLGVDAAAHHVVPELELHAGTIALFVVDLCVDC